jgi:hypothetical protein
MFKATNFDTAVNSIRRDDSSIENRLIPSFGFGLETFFGHRVYYLLHICYYSQVKLTKRTRLRGISGDIYESRYHWRFGLYRIATG